MKIIDFEKKGNVVRFYLGEDDLEKWWGDDWDDYPYESNAGTVYAEYVSGAIDVAFKFDWEVLEPRNGEYESSYCKQDMIMRKVPCIVLVPPELNSEYVWGAGYFKKWVGADGVIKIYFGDDESILDQFEWEERYHDM